MKKLLLLGVLLGALISLVGCGGGDDDNDPANVAGSWLGTVEFQSTTYTIRLSIVQSGSSLTATSVDQTLSTTHNFTGTVSGNSVYLLSIEGNDKREYNINKTSDTTLSGTYTGTNLSTSVSDTGPANFNLV